jgi:hypothetical protein
LIPFSLIQQMETSTFTKTAADQMEHRQARGQAKTLFGQSVIQPELPTDPIEPVENEALFSKAVQVIAWRNLQSVSSGRTCRLNLDWLEFVCGCENHRFQTKTLINTHALAPVCSPLCRKC